MTNLAMIEEILGSSVKPKEKQTKLVEAVLSGAVLSDIFFEYFESAKDSGKGYCADAMKHISAEKPEMLAPYIEKLIEYINYKLPRVKWGVQEAIGNMSKEYPDQTAKAIPNLLKNTTDDSINTTVIKWCAAYALTEIAKNNPSTRDQLVPIFAEIIDREANNGVRNVYIKALKKIEKD